MRGNRHGGPGEGSLTGPHGVLRRISEGTLKLALRRRPRFQCPICDYRGPFKHYRDAHHWIRDTRCPRCASYERHRLQFLVMRELGQTHDFANMAMLHVAPEPVLKILFERQFAVYHSADLDRRGVDYRVDLRAMPFADASYDLVYASHVLEHVKQDERALAEIRRVLGPSGVALLPVPILSPHTIEYPGPNAHEFGHVRAPGLDYFERYRKVFGSVRVWSSRDFDPIHQLYTQEDRSRFPTRASPHRLPMLGECHPDYVPVCSGRPSIDIARAGERVG